MSKPRGKEHTTLTETAQKVVKVALKIAGVKMIAPGEINTASRSKTGKRFITIVKTPAGCELIITGQSVQKVAIHTDNIAFFAKELKQSKNLREFTFKERERMPGV